MNTAAGLPLPKLSRGRFVHGLAVEVGQDHIFAWTDEALFNACGVRIAFTERTGGASQPPYDSLNLKVPGYSDTLDEPSSPDKFVTTNRRILTSALGCEGIPLISPNQVHKDTVVSVVSSAEASIARAMSEAAAGADAVLVDCTGLAALLCFADCVPLVFVAPTGAFAVVHCGWRGVAIHLAQKAFTQLVSQASYLPEDINVYLGAYIHQECFEVSEDTAAIFVREFGAGVVQESVQELAQNPEQDQVQNPELNPEQVQVQNPVQNGQGAYHVDLGAALRQDLIKVGASENRIADLNICCMCHDDQFFSYRKSAGVCGRHGAFAFQKDYRGE